MGQAHVKQNNSQKVRPMIGPLLLSESIFSLILLIHRGSHREVYQEFQPVMTSSTDGAKSCSDHRFRAPPAYTAQLLTASTQSQQPVLEDESNPYTNTNKEKFGSFFSRALAYEVNGFPR